MPEFAGLDEESILFTMLAVEDTRSVNRVARGNLLCRRRRPGIKYVPRDSSPSFPGWLLLDPSLIYRKWRSRRQSPDKIPILPVMLLLDDEDENSNNQVGDCFLAPVLSIWEFSILCR
jgi:hypothetical protein